MSDSDPQEMMRVAKQMRKAAEQAVAQAVAIAARAAAMKAKAEKLDAQINAHLAALQKQSGDGRGKNRKKSTLNPVPLLIDWNVRS